MHGMINRGLQGFVRNCYGPDKWNEVCKKADLPFTSFEAMLRYDDEVTERVVQETATLLKRTRNEILEDFGTFVVSNEKLNAIPRLLRFGGETFIEFLYSLEDIFDYVHGILPYLEVPRIELEFVENNQFILHFDFDRPGYSAIAPGLLRGMADYYGTLIVIDELPRISSSTTQDRFFVKVFDDELLNIENPLQELI